MDFGKVEFTNIFCNHKDSSVLLLSGRFCSIPIYPALLVPLILKRMNLFVMRGIVVITTDSCNTVV